MGALRTLTPYRSLVEPWQKPYGSLIESLFFLKAPASAQQGVARARVSNDPSLCCTGLFAERRAWRRRRTKDPEAQRTAARRPGIMKPALFLSSVHCRRVIVLAWSSEDWLSTGTHADD